MFRGLQVVELVELLETRRVALYHACQYQDFVSYLKLGGVPSRDRLERANLYTTPFTTDEVDRENGVWDKVFLNLQDFGQGFARGHAALPIPYGPLLLQLHPSALLEADDVAVCLRSAGTLGFDRDRESLKTIADVNRLFWKPINEERALANLKFKDALRREFGPAAAAAEVSCTYKTGLLSFAKLLDVLVDPYTIAGIPLTMWTRQAIAGSGPRVSVETRRTDIVIGTYDDIASLVEQRTPRLAEFPNLTGNVFLLDWAERIRVGGLEYQFRRFADYLREGTLKPVTALARTTIRNEYEGTPRYPYDPHGDYDVYERR